MWYRKIKVESPRKIKKGPECKISQVFGHTQDYCFQISKFIFGNFLFFIHAISTIFTFKEIKISLNYCPEPEKSKAKCANNGEGLAVNCTAYTNAVEKVDRYISTFKNPLHYVHHSR